MNTLNGYSKSVLTDNYVLTAAGGHLLRQLVNPNPYNNFNLIFDTTPFLLNDVALGTGVVVTSPNNDSPFIKSWLFNQYVAWYSDYFYFTPGEVICIESWVMRESNASGNAGYYYIGIEFKDKQGNPVRENSGCVYPTNHYRYICPTNSIWNRIYDEYTIPKTHTPYNGSDGGGYFSGRIRFLINHTAGTIPTYFGGIRIWRKNTPTSWQSILDKPTTLSEYGITDNILTSSNSSVTSTTTSITVNLNGITKSLSIPESLPANGGTADKLGYTTIGSTTQPIYLNNGTPTLCTSYSGLFTALSNNNNQLSVTIGGTTKKLTIDYANTAGISNNAQLFQDMSTLPIAGDNMPWEKIVMVDNTGISDIGKELRFNYDNDSDAGGTVLVCTGQYQNTIQLPDKDGTIALIEDLANLGGGTASGYWANVPISSTSSSTTTPTFSNTITGSLVVNPNQTTYREGIRVGATSSKWSLLMLLGPDTTAVGTSTSAKTWGFFNNDGKFYLNKNGSNTLNSNTIHNTDGTWKIGTSSNTSAKLTVYGEIDATSGFFETSDSRLKNFLNEISIDFDKLSQLPKMYFTWKADEKEMPDLQIGTSAQELQKLYPELVRETDGHLTVAYDKLSIVALKAIDELYTMITELKKQNSKLKSKVDRLERRVYYGKKY